MLQKILLSLVLLFSISIHTQIIESNTLTEALKHVNGQNTLVIFDIDNTLAAPKHELGSDEWFNFMVQEKIKEGYDRLHAIHAILPTYFHIQFNIQLYPVETLAPALLKNIANLGIDVIALTARSLYIANRTIEQLNAIDITFAMNHFNQHELVLPMLHPCMYKHGIIFSDNNNKGEALLCFLDTINYHPQKVIFVDDKTKNIHAVESALESRSIPFLGIRYSRCDQKVQSFDSAKATEQLQVFLEERYGTTLPA